MRGLVSACSTILLLGVSAAPAQAQQRRQGKIPSATALPDFDVRTASTARTAALSVAAGDPAGASAARLRAMVDVGGRPVRYSLDDAGRPKTISSTTGLTPPSSADAESIARRFLSTGDTVAPFSAAEAAELRLSQRTHAGSLQVLRFQQYVGGIPVHDSSARVALDEEGRVRLATYDGPAAGTRLSVFAPSLSAAQAVAIVFESLGVKAGEALRALPGNGERQMFEHPEGGTHSPVGVELTAFPMPNGQATLAWRVFADAGGGSYEVLAAADDGRTLLRRSLVSELGSGRVFTVNPLQPSQIRAFGQDWIAPGSALTTGPYVDAYADADGDDRPDYFNVEGLSNGRAASGSQVFDFNTGTGNDAGSRTRAAAVVNAFYHANLAHDYFYGLGFGEAEGNFQQDNGDRGGLGGDAVRVEVQDAAALNNARFFARPDGMAPRMEMGLRTTSGGVVRDFAFDATAILHEYTHGVTTRSVGGPNVVSCLGTVQAGALGEGWSDYFASSFYDNPVFGDYISGDVKNGIRGAAIDRNTRTFADLGNSRFEVHSDGTIWASLLWDVRTALGKQAADSLIFRALALTACNPTFVDARDAILAADGGEHEAELWTVFAARGLGHAASASNATAAVGTVFDANLDLPPGLGAGNRAPQITSRPLSRATLGQPYSYAVRSVDPDGDPRSYALVSGPSGVQVDPSTGEMTWASPTFAAHRIQIEVADGKGGRTIHGFQLRVEAQLAPREPILISGALRSTGLAFLDVPPGVEVMQVRLRGDEGDANLILFAPGGAPEFSYLEGSNETLSIRKPAAGQWIVRVDGGQAYENVSLAADFTAPLGLASPGAASRLSEAESGELFFRVSVPRGAPLLRVTLTGAGDPDLLLAKGRIPLCSSDYVSLSCDDDKFSAGEGAFERVAIENPEPGDYFLTVYGYEAFRDVELRVSFAAPAAQPGAVADGAAFGLMNAPGGISSLFGAGLSDVTAAAMTTPLPKELGGVRVIVGGIEAALFFVSPGQINFQFPAQVSPGATTDVSVLKNGELSDAIQASHRIAAPQVFVNPSTKLPVIAHNDGSLVTPERPARGGEAIVVYLTGLGMVSDTPLDGTASSGSPLAQTLFQASASFGGAPATVLFAGLTPGFVGLSQANLLLPPQLPGGSTLELVVHIDTGVTVYSSNPVSVPAGR